MIGQLNKDSNFGEIKNWFETNMDLLPVTLDSKHIFYNNIKFTAKLYISNVISEIERLGIKDIRSSAIARTSKVNLYMMYENLQFIDNWNADRPILDSIK